MFRLVHLFKIVPQQLKIKASPNANCIYHIPNDEPVLLQNKPQIKVQCDLIWKGILGLSEVQLLFAPVTGHFKHL
jgi:hypothetical protein